MAGDRLEVMAPVGSFECLHAALQGGADSVYFGVGKLNMRARSAGNFAAEDVPKIVSICRDKGVRTYLTLNIALFDDEVKDAYTIVDMAKAAGVDAVIASDMAAIQYCRSVGMEVHISTQLSVSNYPALKFYSQWADVVVLARELNLDQVAMIHAMIQEEDLRGPSGNLVRIEMFVHGALCMAVSGKCFLSLHNCGGSANRGACYQLCRRGYKVTDLETGAEMVVDNKYIMSPKDLCTIEFLDKIVKSGVRVFKIEGRARSAEYVKRSVECYRRAADAVLDGSFTREMGSNLKESLAEVFNRGFWNGFYQGATMGEWSQLYGSSATKKKLYVGKVVNWFDKIGVAELAVETTNLHVGENIMVIGATTGVVEMPITDMRIDFAPVQLAPKGSRCSISSSVKLHRGDKIFLWIDSGRKG